MTVAAAEQANVTDMTEVNALAYKLLTTHKGRSLSKQYLDEIGEDDDLATIASVISYVYDRGSGKMGGTLPYFLMLYELTKYVREKGLLLPDDEKERLMKYVEEGEEELRCIAESERERDSLLSEI